LAVFNPDLNYIIFFVYEIFDTVEDDGGVAVGASGFETPVSNMPTTGSATYTGHTFGYVANLTTHDNSRVEGDISLTAFFSSSTLLGTITNTMVSGVSEDHDTLDFGLALPSPVAWNNFSLSASFNNGNRFAGTITTTNAPGGLFGLPNGLSGSLAGQFFGPNAEEMGGAWSIEYEAGDILAGGSFGASSKT
jgi:hypothetical protein